jgi:hypothetical protein
MIENTTTKSTVMITMNSLWMWSVSRAMGVTGVGKFQV